ncbi:hypothetical protein NM81858_2267 [Neisseria meningitidis 81858]|nr:hypothetical protein NM81858_2267 [Neisseria meningitidis 81858]
MDNLHGAAAQNIRRAHDQRIADFFGFDECFFFVVGDAVGRLAQT